MIRTRAVAVLGLVLLLGLVGAWLFGALILKSAGPGPGTARGEKGSPAPELDGLLAELQIIPLSGQAAPAFKLETLDGQPLALADLAGRPAFLYFWATW